MGRIPANPRNLSNPLESFNYAAEDTHPVGAVDAPFQSRCNGGQQEHRAHTLSHILAVSPLQLLDIWDELHSGMSGKNSFGGDVVEVYFYRLMAHSSLAAVNPTSPLLDEDFYASACNLHAICRLFEKRHDVTITFESGENIDLLLAKNDLNRHRTHLRVTRRASLAEAD